MTLLDLHQNVLTVDKSRLIDEVLSGLSKTVIKLNQDQLDLGLNAKGGRFRKYANGGYAKKKSGMNPKPGLGNPDLKVTGAFVKAFKTDLKSGIMDIYSTDHKAGWLEDGTSRMKAFADIYGLTDDSMSQLRADFLILFNNKLRAEIGLQ